MSDVRTFHVAHFGLTPLILLFSSRCFSSSMCSHRDMQQQQRRRSPTTELDCRPIQLSMARVEARKHAACRRHFQIASRVKQIWQIWQNLQRCQSCEVACSRFSSQKYHSTRLGHPPLLSPLAAVVRGVSALLNLDFDFPLVNIQKLKSFILVFVG